MQIVDNSPEMDPSSPDFAEKLATLAASKKEPKAEEKGEQKKSEKATAASDKESGKESPSTDAAGKEDQEEGEDTDAKIKALKKELKRVRDNKREDEDRVSKLQEEISSLKAEIKKPAGNDQRSMIQAALDKLDEEGLEAQLTNWDDELADARAKLALAEDRNDEAKIEQAQARVSKARTVLSLTRSTLRERSKQASEAKQGAEQEKGEIAKELDAIFKTYVENFPDLEDKESKLWEAGNAMYNKHPKLMKRLGPIAELVAVSLAVASDPKLVGKDASKVRKDLLHNIEEAALKSLVTGNKGSSRGKAPTVDVDNPAAFEAYIEKIKSGG